MISQTVLVLLFFLHTLVDAIKERDVFVKLGDNFQFCCELNHKENQALILYQGRQRLRSLVRLANSKQIDANSEQFFATHMGYTMKKTTESVESLCVEKREPGAIIDDNKMEFLCELIEEMGLGCVVDSEKITIRTYELPVVNPLPAVLESVVNGPVSVKCSAIGHPDLKLRWLNGATKVVYAEDKVLTSSDGRLELVLTLDNVTPEMDGQELVCEALTSYPRDSSTVQRQSLVISVSYPPQIDLEADTIHTALGEAENILITVHGNPKAVLVCDSMDLFGSRQLEELPEEKLGVNQYRLRLHGVTEEDLGSHFCSATNRFRTVRKNFTLTIAPSKPEVISPAFTNNADYYLLGWRSRSKLPLRNVTFRIQTLNNNEANNTKETRMVMLNDTTVARVNTSSDELQEFWHHLSNLTFGSEHRIHIRACNEHACNEFDLQLPDVAFRTMDGANKINPDILSHPPSAALRASVFRDFNAENDSAFKTLAWHLVMLVVSLVINL